MTNFNSNPTINAIDFKNGVQFLPLTVENDFNEGNRIVNVSYITEFIDVWQGYNNRLTNPFVGTYAINVSRVEDYNRFIDLLKEVRCDSRSKIQSIHNKWYRDEIEHDEMQQLINDARTCTCQICSMKVPTIEEWKTGILKETVYIDNEFFKGEKVKEISIGKALKKHGFEQVLIDFYSSQVKDEKTVYITISDRVQHILGMSYYAKLDTWNGYSGTSCQDPRHDTSLARSLAGAIHDNRLLVAMLHDNIEDLDDMTDKLKARCLMRITDFENDLILTGCRYYGNNVTKDTMRNAMKQLEFLGIYDDSIHEGDYSDLTKVRNVANGAYVETIEEDVYICETVDRDVDIECPMCDGHGEHTVYDDDEDEHEVECPMCNGSGEHTINVYEDIETTITVEKEKRFLPYNGEGFDHEEGYTLQWVNATKLREDKIKYSDYRMNGID